MQRILVMGPCGSGKSTLASAIGKQLGLPVYHMDQISHKPGWVERSKTEIAKRIDDIIATDRWVIDGNDGATLPARLIRTDIVLFLDFQIALCVSRIIKRVWQYRGRVRPDMADGCPERFSLAFLLYAARWNHGPRQRNEALLKGSEAKIIRFSSPGDLQRWMDSLPAVA